ncbi:hypothetical protein BH11MYX4_BH11MYX4_20180 [soil metagenome]
MRALRAGVLALAVTHCGDAGRAEHVGTAESAITNGAPDGGHLAVGALFASAGFQCSATLVGTRTVLTAAHCIAPGVTGYRFVVEGRSFEAASVTPHPLYDPSSERADVGVVMLAEAPPAPPMSLSPDAPVVGLPITIVGLGCPDGTAKGCVQGTRRVARNVVDTVTGDEIVFTTRAGDADAGGHCDGDSGGPALAAAGEQEVVVGVNTWGAIGCHGANRDARVDTVLAWLASTSGGDVRIAPHGSWLQPAASPPAARGCAVAR